MKKHDPPAAQRELARLWRQATNERLTSKFSQMWKAISGQVLAREYKFCDDRNWKFDFAHPQSKVAIELEGGVHTGGRHTRGEGFEKDCEKYNEAAFLGWAVIRMPGNLIHTPLLISIRCLITARSL